ncbi:DHS-like NAD/FAD-binding domain-containing protein [Punctularia strigosozonata HHB-11173 SS5]|uniref:DHS-like NAD/FAD-binding domain-containing protein n=1 Tax=Punctularia strigosozonata (strain HHB-11173) TaxID=741275 RepID=UPI0004417BE4|nr:DHS-like NAD/FAD-binding domain-containing protein [Punctularia strigosozonata HHB-11173 SS5]EIN09499.1 DHS-like NAD/FAD-binding domain-containing protein [Punctularia strigosozonata HHB-11173 SS5]
MRVSVPTIPTRLASVPSGPTVSPAVAVERISSFLQHGNVCLLTGAGVSVDSGIRAYRGKDGRYMNPNYKPIFYHELVDGTEKGFAFRQRYWLRSYLGYPPVRDAQPNKTHYAIAALQHASIVPRLITQNVDGLHHKAIRSARSRSWMDEHMLELHGTLHKVHCNRGHLVDRETFQDWISAANPQWKAFVDDLERAGQQPRTNPDGDVAIEDVDYTTFNVPECPTCALEGYTNSVQKPALIFFGESIAKEVRDKSYADIEQCDRLFLVGTTLATFSAFRLLKHALELKKPTLMLNVGPTRADGLPGLEKLEIRSGEVMREIVRNVLGSQATEDPIIRDMLCSGIYMPPPDHIEDIVPQSGS